MKTLTFEKTFEEGCIYECMNQEDFNEDNSGSYVKKSDCEKLRLALENIGKISSQWMGAPFRQIRKIVKDALIEYESC